MQGAFTIARIRGIRIRVHLTFLLVLPLIVLLFARTYESFASAALMAGVPPHLIRGTPLFWGAMVALALFASVLLHELAHAFYALSKGGKVHDITLLMIGGVARVAEPPKEPRQEAAMALVGPLASFGIAAVCFVAHLILAGTDAFSLRFAFFYLAGLNLGLGAFNLLPAFPMDGGRVLRGLLAGRLGMVRATQVAATLGKVFAVIFIVAGLLTLNFLLMMIALFVYMGAEAESGQVVARSVLGQVRVADLMTEAPIPVEATMTVQDAADHMVQARRLGLPVTRDGQLAGVVSLDDVKRVPLDKRDSVLVQAVTRPAEPCAPGDNLWDAFRRMSDGALPLLPVVQDGQLVGVVQHDDIARGLRLHELQAQPPQPRWRRRPVES